MNNAVQDLPDHEHNGTRNTGFPEPLSTGEHSSSTFINFHQRLPWPFSDSHLERNTTLPYPTADTSPTASIEAADVPLNRTSSRLRFHRKHSKATSKGQIDPDRMYDNITYEGGSVDLKSKVDNSSGSQLTKDSSLNSDMAREKMSYERSSVELDMLRRGDGETESQDKKKHFLRKLRKH